MTHADTDARERKDRIADALKSAGLDAVVCAFPANVLLLSGYWPVIGTAAAVATREGRIVVLAPQDEHALAQRGWADEVRSYQPGSLTELRTAAEALRPALGEIARDYALSAGNVGYERGPMSQTVTYSAMNVYGAALLDVLADAFGATSPAPADDILTELRAVKTPYEVDRIRAACEVAGAAYETGSAELTAGSRETEVAARFRSPMSIDGIGEDDDVRADGFTFCMSGPNAAEAFGAYARSRGRPIAKGDFVLMHCNSYLDGYWTDITRTYCVGAPDERQRTLYDAIFAARAAALAAIRPGAHAADVDRAARDVLHSRGLGEAFKHGTGHGIGFGAIDAASLPRIHPASPDRLRPGMVFNIEPAVYFGGYGGLRHCDVVTVTDTGVEVLTRFQTTADSLILGVTP